VGKDNSAARRFYERNGYRISGEEEGEWSFIDNFGLRQVVHEPSWRMEKDILQVGIVNN
jgi:ribosomal protein S18 acetylase RimI-like enzyme